MPHEAKSFIPIPALVSHMRSQEAARNDAKHHAAQLIDALQDADADRHLIDRAERLQSRVSDLDEPETEAVTHKFSVGDYALDSDEPTPSPEANTVEIVELKDARADEFTIEETGKTVAEHNPYRPSDDPVVAGIYPHMGGDKTFHFPESRLRDV